MIRQDQAINSSVPVQVTFSLGAQVSHEELRPKLGGILNLIFKKLRMNETPVHTGEGNGHPPQYSCLENPRDRGAWWATVHGVTKSQI